jgi:hypothetical protein
MNATNEKEEKAFYSKQENETKLLIFENWNMVRYVLNYFINDKDIFDHGGSVIGWLTDKDFKEQLDIWHELHILNQ